MWIVDGPKFRLLNRFLVGHPSPTRTAAPNASCEQASAKTSQQLFIYKQDEFQIRIWDGEKQVNLKTWRLPFFFGHRTIWFWPFFVHPLLLNGWAWQHPQKSGPGRVLLFVCAALNSAGYRWQCNMQSRRNWKPGRKGDAKSDLRYLSQRKRQQNWCKCQRFVLAKRLSDLSVWTKTCKQKLLPCKIYQNLTPFPGYRDVSCLSCKVRPGMDFPTLEHVPEAQWISFCISHHWPPQFAAARIVFSCR